MSQLNLFATGIVCDVCGRDPEVSVKNVNVWPGFRDADTNTLVCWGCRDRHYEEKSRTEKAGMYSEVPVVIQTEKLKLKRTVWIMRYYLKNTAHLSSRLD